MMEEVKRIQTIKAITELSCFEAAAYSAARSLAVAVKSAARLRATLQEELHQLDGGDDVQ